jgi:hypothetical protein
MPFQLTIGAISFFATLLEQAEETQSICDDVAMWRDAKPHIEELWQLYAEQLESAKRAATH